MVRLWEPSRTGEASLQNLTFAVKVVRCYGLWRSDGDTKLYKLYTFVISMAFFLAYVKIFVFSITAAADKKLFMESISVVFGITPAFVSTVLILAFSRNFTEIIERFRSFISFVHSGKEQWKYVGRCHSTVGKRKVTMYYLAFGEISFLSYLLRPILTHIIFGNEAGFPLRQLVMFDNNRWPTFIVQYLAQILVCNSLWAATISLDMFYFNIIASCSHQLKVLSSMIINVANTMSGEAELVWEKTRVESKFEQSPQSPKYVNMFSNYSKGLTTIRSSSLVVPQQRILASEEQKNIEVNLATLCEWHQETLKTTGEVSKLLNIVMLSHYLITSIKLCMSAYNFLNNDGQSLLISFGLILLLVLYRILILGWISSELSSESLSIADAAYSCNWYDLSLNAKKTLIIMMARAQSPVVIRAGPTGSLSLETCKKLLEAAYTYLNVLNKMK